MVNVCAKYGGTTILIDQFPTKTEAEDFMKHDYVLYYSDEVDGALEDEIIKSNEMFLEDELPFYEPIKKNEIIFNTDELPF